VGTLVAGLLYASLATACAGRDGALEVAETPVAELADIPVTGVDRIEVRQVFPTSDDESAVEAAMLLPTPFGASAATIGEAGIDDVDGVVAAIGQAAFLDTCGVTYDMSNPDVEVVLLDGDDVVARLGYNLEVAAYGECEVPSRWIDEDWRLLALTVELPAALLADLD
jgi:hypothetical protein